MKTVSYSCFREVGRWSPLPGTYSALFCADTRQPCSMGTYKHTRHERKFNCGRKGGRCPISLLKGTFHHLVRFPGWTSSGFGTLTTFSWFCAALFPSGRLGKGGKNFLKNILPLLLWLGKTTTHIRPCIICSPACRCPARQAREWLWKWRRPFTPPTFLLVSLPPHFLNVENLPRYAKIWRNSVLCVTTPKCPFMHLV